MKLAPSDHESDDENSFQHLTNLILLEFTWILEEHLLFHLHPIVSTSYYSTLYSWTPNYPARVEPSQEAEPTPRGTGNEEANGIRPQLSRAEIWRVDSPRDREHRIQSMLFAAETAATLCPREWWRFCFTVVVKLL